VPAGRSDHRERLANSGDGMSKSFRQAIGLLLSPCSFGLVAIPESVAWGAVSAPFCLIRGLSDDGPAAREIKISD